MPTNPIRKLEKLVSQGRYDDAADLATRIFRENGYRASKDAIPLLERCVPHSDIARLLMVTLYSLGIVAEPHRGAAAEWLAQAMRSLDDAIARQARIMLGTLQVRQGQPHLGMKTLREAAAAGIPEAKVSLALLYVSGAPGLKPDLERAITMLVEAVDDDVPTARVVLAQIMIERGLNVEGVDLEELLTEAIDSDDLAEDAAELLESISDGEDPDDEYGDDDLFMPRDILPYEVVPDGLERPAAARDALADKTGMPPEVAGYVVARLTGFDSWDEMSEAAHSPDMPKGVFDEDCGAEQFNERQAIQTEVLISNGFLDEIVAEKVVELLGVTGRTGTPSLGDLEKELSGRIIKESRREIEEHFRDMLEAFGLEGHLDSFMGFARSRNPIRPKAWLGALERFGWKLGSKRPKARKDGSLIGRTASSDGTGYDVYLSAVTYLPGDKGDVHVERQMCDIASKGSPAILLFNHPIGLVTPKKSKGLLYGGRLFSGSEWWDFVLRPGAGVDDAIKQRGKLTGKPTAAFVREYSFEDAREACVEIDAESRGERLDDGTPVGFIQHSNGWVTPITGDGADILRAAMEIRR